MWFSYPDYDFPLPQKHSRGYPQNKAINRAHKANDRHRRNKAARKMRKMQRRKK